MVKVSLFLDVFFLLTLIPLYFYAPLGASEVIMVWCLVIFYYQFVRALRSKRFVVSSIPSIVQPETMFMLFFYILFYLPYQNYLLGFGALDASWYTQYAYLEYVNISIVASTIGLVVFMIGVNKKVIIKTVANYSQIREYRFLPLVIIILFCLSLFAFILKGGLEALTTGAYATSDLGTSVDNGVFFLVTFFSMLSLAVSFFFYKSGKRNLSLLLSIAICGLWCFLLLVIGDRNNFFLIALVPFCAYVTYIKRINIMGFVLCVFAALFIYGVIEISRMDEERGLSAIAKALFDGGDDMKSIDEGSFSISTTSSRAAFAIVPEKHDLFLGKFTFISAAGIIPFSRSLFVSPDDPHTTSSKVLADEMIGTNATWGVGSNIISDLYLQFGLAGIILGMYLMGYIAAYTHAKASIDKNSILWASVYVLIVAHYAEMPRYTFTFPLRVLAWTFLIFLIYKILMKNRKA